MRIIKAMLYLHFNYSSLSLGLSMCEKFYSFLILPNCHFFFFLKEISNFHKGTKTPVTTHLLGFAEAQQLHLRLTECISMFETDSGGLQRERQNDPGTFA